MPKGDKFLFACVSIWIWLGHKLLSFACLCPIVELYLDLSCGTPSIMVELCVIIYV
jgi:hypothetical protein